MSPSALLAPLIVTLAVVAPPAAAYPDRPIRFIVPTTTGGGADTLARHLGARLVERFNHQVVIDNRPGANGITGVDACAKATPDGHTLLMTFTDHFVYPALYRNLPFDMGRDFAPVSFVGSLPFVLAVTASLPATTVQELVAHARAKPGELSFGSAGTGGTVHLAGELFRTVAGIDIRHVPYKGTSAALPDLAAGRIQLMFPSAITARPLADTGRLRLLAVTSRSRAQDLPSLPTVAESGFPEFDVGIWYGVMVPARTPVQVVRTLNAEIGRIARDPGLQALMLRQGVTLAPGTAEAFSAFARDEAKRWAKVVRDANVPPAN